MNAKDIVISVFSVAIKVVVGVIIVMFIYKYATMAYDYGHRIFSEPAMTEGEGRTVTVAISPEMGVSEIGMALENKGLIRDSKLFWLQERLSEYHGMIQPGMYDLSTSMTAEEMIAVMAADAIKASTEEESEAFDNNYIMSESSVEYEEDYEDGVGAAEGYEAIGGDDEAGQGAEEAGE